MRSPLTALILHLDHFNGNEPVTQLYSGGAGQYEGAQLERNRGPAAAGFTESPAANSPAQDLTVASLCAEKDSAQTIAIYYIAMA